MAPSRFGSEVQKLHQKFIYGATSGGPNPKLMMTLKKACPPPPLSGGGGGVPIKRVQVGEKNPDFPIGSPPPPSIWHPRVLSS